MYHFIKFVYYEKATKFCKISTVDFSYVVTVKSPVEILQNFVAFSEFMNFKCDQTRSYQNASLCLAGPRVYFVLKGVRSVIIV